MRIQNITSPLFVLACLLTLSFGLFSVAQESSSTADNIFMDSDQDGLSDQEEISYGTDPRSNDTDKDGYSDGKEVGSGYDPLRPAPGDRIISQSNGARGNATTDDGKNLTKDVAKKISELTQSADAENEEISVEQISALVSDSVNQPLSESDLPTIDSKSIKILEQKYSKLSEEKRQTKLKEDFENYLVAIYYVLASNSPKPITSTTDITSVISSMTRQIVSSVTLQDTSSLDDLNESGKHMLEQLQEVRVPEDAIDLHIKGLQLAQYAISLKDTLKSDQGDPLENISNLSRASSFTEVAIGFISEIEEKITEYDIEYDDALKEKMSDLGIEAPDKSGSSSED